MAKTEVAQREDPALAGGGDGPTRVYAAIEKSAANGASLGELCASVGTDDEATVKDWVVNLQCDGLVYERGGRLFVL